MLTRRNLSTLAGDLDLILRVVNEAQPWLLEPAIVPIPWTPHISLPPKLRVGFFVSDGVVTPQPPIKRAMKVALEALGGRHDVELVPYKPFRHAEANALIVGACICLSWLTSRTADIPLNLVAPALFS